MSAMSSSPPPCAEYTMTPHFLELLTTTPLFLVVSSQLFELFKESVLPC